MPWTQGAGQVSRFTWYEHRYADGCRYVLRENDIGRGRDEWNGQRMGLLPLNRTGIGNSRTPLVTNEQVWGKGTVLFDGTTELFFFDASSSE
jgi:hypothetical protein